MDREASPLLKGILAEARPLAEVQKDRVRAEAIRALSLPLVCAKVQSDGLGVAHA